MSRVETDAPLVGSPMKIWAREHAPRPLTIRHRTCSRRKPVLLARRRADTHPRRGREVRERDSSIRRDHRVRCVSLSLLGLRTERMSRPATSTSPSPPPWSSRGRSRWNEENL